MRAGECGGCGYSSGQGAHALEQRGGIQDVTAACAGFAVGREEEGGAEETQGRCLHFADTPSFSKFFSRMKGQSPRVYRES